MVLFFSGTGNSKFVAQKVAEILNDEARDISDYLKRKQIPDFTEDGVYVFVAPSYVSAPARAMIDFIDQATFPEGIKVYFLITCVASMGVSPEVAKRLSEKKGFKYMGSAQIDMPQNYIIYFKTKEADENFKIINNAIPQIENVAIQIKKGEKFKEKNNRRLELLFTDLVGDLYYKFFMKTKKFTVSDECISCGKCAVVCPFGNIKVEAGKPVWGDECTHCMGCINSCPKEAIEYGKGTVGKPRYPGPFDTLKKAKK
ncbi:MAG: 4Fe-4S dicluster domain-containing protein [Butyrivibrio sp.]|nr:4Fe-4S dicluster domain-containing protein [Butyrivibrio sp.]